MANLFLKKDGSLIRKVEFFNKEKGIWDFSESNVNDIAWGYLSDYIEFDEGVTLKDFFGLIQENLEIFESIFGNWISEYTNLILNGVSEPRDAGEQPMDYLRVYWRIEIDDKEGEINLPSWPEFDGVGVASHDDQYYKKGDIIKWGLGFSHMQDYADLPLKLDDLAEVWYSNENHLKQYRTFPFTLYQVIQGITWEISFHGSPDESKKVMQDLDEQIKRIKSGEEKTYPIEDLWKDLNLDDD